MVEDKLTGKRVLFFGGSSGRDDLMLALAKEMQQRHQIKPYYICFSPGSKEYVAERGFPVQNIFAKVLEGNNTYLGDVKFLLKAEEKYDFRIFDLWHIDAPRKKERLTWPIEKIYARMEFVVKETEFVLEKVKPDYVVLTGVAGSHIVILYKMLEHFKIPILQLVNARLPNTFTFNNNLYDGWPFLIAKYNKNKKNGLSDNERKKAEELIKEFKIKKFKPEDSTKIRESIKDKVKRYMYYLKVFKHRKELPSLKKWFWYPVKDKIMRRSKIFEMPVEGEKFVFYPLQIQPEASTSIMAKFYTNQLALIESIAKCLPCDYKFYVKEHVKNFAGRPSYFHQEIKRNRNVRLISPKANTFDLIKDSSLVLTITGTAGWEAVMLQKPVLTFGNVYYNAFDEVKKVECIGELQELIEERLDTIIDKEKTLEFVSAMESGTFEGIAALPGDCQNRSLGEENITLLVNGIEKYVERL